MKEGGNYESSFRKHSLDEILAKLIDQVIHRTKDRDLDFKFTVQDYMQHLPGACKMGLKAVLSAIDNFQIEIPFDGRLEGRFILPRAADSRRASRR